MLSHLGVRHTPNEFCWDAPLFGGPLGTVSLLGVSGVERLLSQHGPQRQALEWGSNFLFTVAQNILSNSVREAELPQSGAGRRVGGQWKVVWEETQGPVGPVPL